MAVRNSVPPMMEQRVSHSRPILVVGGSIHYDVILHLPHLPEDNDRLAPTAVTLAPGGMGGNVAAAAARLGAEVRFVGSFSDDADGIALRTDLERDGVDTRWAGTRPVDGPGGRAHRGLILVDAEGRRAILGGWPDADRLDRAPGQAPGLTIPVDPSAWRTAMPPLALPAAVFAGENVAVACPFNLAPLMLDSVPDGIPVHLDIESGHVAGWRDDEIHAVLRRTTVLYGNQRTLAAFARRLDQPSVTALSRSLRDRTTIVETAGDLGCQVHANGVRTVIPPFPADAVDTTGAGDCFAAACTVALREGMPLHEAARFANAAAALSTRALGSRPAIPTRAELDAAIARRTVEAETAERSATLAPFRDRSRNPLFDLIVAPAFVTDDRPDDPNADLLSRATLHR